MAQTNHVSGVATSTRKEGEWTIIRYHDTDVVKFSDDKIVLDSGGWLTNTTKTRMNQASNQYSLGYVVFQKNRSWFVKHKGEVKDFSDGMTLSR